MKFESLLKETSKIIYKLIRSCIFDTIFKELKYVGYSYSIAYHKNLSDFMIEKSVFNGSTRIGERVVSNILKYLVKPPLYKTKDYVVTYKKHFSRYFDTREWLAISRHNIFFI